MTNKEPKVLVIVVSYNPEIKKIYSNVNKLITSSNIFVYLSDNGSNNIEDLKKKFDTCKQVILDINGKNVGLATAQNKGLNFALQNDFDFVCFFDQDTLIPENFISSMVNEFELLDRKIGVNNVGILAPNYFDPGTHEYAHYAKLNNHSYDDEKFKKEHFLEVSFVVSSGSFLKISVIKNVGLLKDRYFIDQVDTEYSLRVLNKGYRIFATSNVELVHTIGHRNKKRFLGLTIKPNYHSALRKYYIFRNGIRTVIDYKADFPGIRILMFKRFVHDFLGVVLYEDNKAGKLNAMLRGLFDGMQNVESWDSDER